MEKEILKKEAENGLTLFRYADKEIEDMEDMDAHLLNGELNFRFAIILSKFKSFVTLFGDNEYEKYGVLLCSLIKDVEREIDEMTEAIKKSIGGISFLYETDGRWPGYMDQKVIGLALSPNKKV